MSLLDPPVSDSPFTTSGEDADAWNSISLGASDAFTDLYSPRASLFGGESAFSTPTAAPVSITLLQSEDWASLIAGIKFDNEKGTLDSSTSYTISDSVSGVSIQFVGTDFTSETVQKYLVLATGTVTGINITLNGLTIVSGAGFSVSASRLLTTLETCVYSGLAGPLFDLFFGQTTTVSGTAAIVASSLSFLASYSNLTTIEVTGGGAPPVSVSDFKTYETLLKKVAGGFEIYDTEADIKAALMKTGSKLFAAAAEVASLVISDGATKALKLTAAEDATASKLLSKLGGSAIVDVLATTGAWTTTGHGDGLTIHDLAGVDAITGGGASELFEFASGWGRATITDFAQHYATPGNDTVQFAKSEFAHGATTLLADAKLNAAGTAVIVTAGTDRLKLTGLTLSELKTAIGNGDFTFV